MIVKNSSTAPDDKGRGLGGIIMGFIKITKYYGKLIYDLYGVIEAFDDMEELCNIS